MKVVITGGYGFLGTGIARAVLARGGLTGPSGEPESIDEIVLFDQAVPEGVPAGLADSRVRGVAGDIGDKATVEALIDRDDVSVFHLASVVSAGGEKDFDSAIHVNLNGMVNVLDALRARAGQPRLVFASSLAVFGADPGGVVSDATKPQPGTTYGMTKAVGEMLINDYARKGFVDGRAGRLATVIIRPGRPNAAASSFASGVFREPLNGETCVVPVSLETPMALMGAQTCIDGFIALHEADGATLGADRGVNFPNGTWTVAEMIATLKRVAAEDSLALGLIEQNPDPLVQSIVEAWPRHLEFTRARALGLPEDESLDAIIRAFVAATH